MLLLQALLGLEPGARKATLSISPLLPKGIDDMAVSGLRVGNSRANLLLWRDPANGKYGVSSSSGPGEAGTLKVSLIQGKYAS